MKSKKAIETRNIDIKSVSIETREDGEKRMLTGIIPYDSLSKDLGGFRERIRRGAFSKTISDGFDVRALVNHDPSKILGRVKNNTLHLEDTEQGLRATVDLGNQSYATDLFESISRDDVSTLSFGFRVIKDEFERGEEERSVVRNLKEVHLIEVSFGVTFPAYEETASTAAFRSLYEGVGIDIDTFNQAILRAATDEELTEEEIESLRALQTWIEQRVVPEQETQEQPPVGTDPDVLERELALLEL